MKKILLMIMAGMLLMMSTASAEKIKFVEYASYRLGSADSEITAHDGARKECLKKAAAAGGTYVESYSREKNFILEQEETTILSASIIRAIEIEGESGLSRDRSTYNITMAVTLDTIDIQKVLDRRYKNKKEKTAKKNSEMPKYAASPESFRHVVAQSVRRPVPPPMKQPAV